MNKLFKNEWDLLNLVMTEIENKGIIKFKMVKAEKDNKGYVTFAGLKYKGQIYLTQEEELDQVIAILHRAFKITIYSDRKRLDWIIYQEEFLPEHLKLPF